MQVPEKGPFFVSFLKLIEVQKSITVIGAGRVGSALGKSLFAAGHSIDLVVSATQESALELAAAVNSEWTTDTSTEIVSDILVLAVPDSQLRHVVSGLTLRKNCCIVHTAGAFGTEVFDMHRGILNGVLYPFQTFTRGRDIDMAAVPFLVEGNNRLSLELIEALAMTISGSVYRVSADNRKLVHVAGVFVNNFVNHLYGIGEDLVEAAGLPPEILNPLLSETRDKQCSLGSDKAQTGPAVRNDTNTIEKHLELLSYSPELSDIYELISNLIIKRFSK